MSRPDQLLDLAIDAARQAANLVQRHAAAGVSVAATKSSDVDVVTRADQESEELIRVILLAARPHDAVLGEEGDDIAGTSGVRWIVDPIDGTVNFLYGLPDFAISIAAEVDGVVVAGVVLNAATGVLYAGLTDEAGTRSWVETPGVAGSRPLAVRRPVPLSQQLILTGFAYDASLRVAQAQACTRLLARVRDIRRHGSAALELCRIAAGQADAYLEVGVNLWDYAAGAFIACAAGARLAVVPGLGGRDLVVCAPAESFDVVMAAAQDAGFTERRA